MDERYSVYCGIDVGKWEHHAVVFIPASGEIVFDAKVRQSEEEIQKLLGPLIETGRVIVVVDKNMCFWVMIQAFLPL